MKKNSAICQKTFFALDGLDLKEACGLSKKYQEKGLYGIKIGMELFYRYGPESVRELREVFDGKIFLDLKLHDIPKTVHQAIKSLSNLPVDFLTLHLFGGEEMLKEAISARNQYLPKCKLLGVTFLTSLDQQDFKDLWNYSPEETQKRMQALGQLVKKVSLDGLILSGSDLALYQGIPPEILRNCPGIRFEKQDINDDQKRVITPDEALKSGADFLVIGRALKDQTYLPKNFWVKE